LSLFHEQATYLLKVINFAEYLSDSVLTFANGINYSIHLGDEMNISWRFHDTVSTTDIVYCEILLFEIIPFKCRLKSSVLWDIMPDLSAKVR
jgi:hypothetical protein